MTQDDIASILHTQKPAISRLETCHENVKSFPSLLTLVKFASAIGDPERDGKTKMDHVKDMLTAVHYQKQLPYNTVLMEILLHS